MNLLSFGDQVERGSYTVHSRFKRAVNFSNGRRLVFLVSQEIGAGPLNIVLAGAGSHRALPASLALRIQEQLLEVDERRFSSIAAIAIVRTSRFRIAVPIVSL